MSDRIVNTTLMADGLMGRAPPSTLLKIGKRYSVSVLIIFTMIIEGLSQFGLLYQGGVHVFGFQFYFVDVISIAIGAVALAMFVAKPFRTLSETLLALIFLLSAVNFLRGLSAYGTAAGVDFRQDMLLLSTIMLLAQIAKGASITALTATFAAFGLLELIIYFGRASGILPLDALSLLGGSASFNAFRYINASGAFFVFCSALVFFGAALVARRYRRALWVMGILAATVVFSAMHRTVWVVEGTGLVAFLVLGVRHRLMPAVTFFLFVTFILLFALAAVISVLSVPQLQDALMEVGKQSSTLQWRVEGWRGLLARTSPMDYLIGHGYGADYSRRIMGQLIDAGAHNFFIAKLWQLGLVGVVLYLAIIIGVLADLTRWARRSDDRESRTIAVILACLLIGQFAFFATYDMGLGGAFILGWALAFTHLMNASGSPSAARKSRRVNAPAVAPRRYAAAAHREL
jgi:O-antigen ligase